MLCWCEILCSDWRASAGRNVQHIFLLVRSKLGGLAGGVLAAAVRVESPVTMPVLALSAPLLIRGSSLMTSVSSVVGAYLLVRSAVSADG